jgi:hypothetical protein
MQSATIAPNFFRTLITIQFEAFGRRNTQIIGGQSKSGEIVLFHTNKKVAEALTEQLDELEVVITADHIGMLQNSPAKSVRVGMLQLELVETPPLSIF